MNTELSHEEEEVVDGEIVYAIVPWTSEALPVHQLSLDALAVVLDEARQFERDRLSTFKRNLQDEVLGRVDAAVRSGEQDSWTVHIEGGIKLVCDTPDRKEWDVNELRAELKQLVAEDEIEEHWIEKIIVPERYKVAKREVQRLLRLGGVPAERLKAIERPSGRPRSVKVERS